MKFTLDQIKAAFIAWQKKIGFKEWHRIALGTVFAFIVTVMIASIMSTNIRPDEQRSRQAAGPQVDQPAMTGSLAAAKKQNGMTGMQGMPGTPNRVCVEWSFAPRNAAPDWECTRRDTASVQSGMAGMSGMTGMGMGGMTSMQSEQRTPPKKANEKKQ